MQAHFHTLERPSAGTTRTHKTKCKWLLTGLAQHNNAGLQNYTVYAQLDINESM